MTITEAKEEVIRILEQRDKMPRTEAEQCLEEALEAVQESFRLGEDPEEVWMEEVGLEVDYLLAIIGY